MREQNGNTVLTTIGLALACLGLAAVVGCAAAGQTAKAPTGVERLVYDITTNLQPKVVTQTNVVTTWQTNQAVQSVTVTNAVGVLVPQYVTNVSTAVSYWTNVVTMTNLVPVYTETPKAGAATAASAAGGVVNSFAPGFGSLVTAGITGLLALVAGVRNRQYASQVKGLSAGQQLAQQAAGVLAQEIETLRNIISTTPQGAQLGAAISNFLVQHQAEAGVVQHVAQIVATVVDEPTAKQAAQEVLALQQQLSGSTAAKT